MRNGCSKLGLPRQIYVILLTCRGCKRSVIIDGNHRMTRLAKRLSSVSTDVGDMPATVLELSGTRWSKKTPDMNIVCRCKP